MEETEKLTVYKLLHLGRGRVGWHASCVAPQEIQVSGRGV